jgi:phosphohistidine phosphatase
MLLTLIRHAKSSWNDSSLKDFERPLNERGITDALKMANWFSDNTQEKPILYSSPANRALSTARYFEKELINIQLNIVDDLYHANLQDYKSLILENNHEKHVVIFGHNPTISYVAEEILKTKSIYLKTCSICQINIAKPDALSGVLNFLKSPKELT